MVTYETVFESFYVNAVSFIRGFVRMCEEQFLFFFQEYTWGSGDNAITIIPAEFLLITAVGSYLLVKALVSIFSS